MTKVRCDHRQRGIGRGRRQPTGDRRKALLRAQTEQVEINCLVSVAMASHHTVEAERESNGQLGGRRSWSHVSPEVSGMEQRVVQKADYKDISWELPDPSLLPGRLALCSI